MPPMHGVHVSYDINEIGAHAHVACTPSVARFHRLPDDIGVCLTADDDSRLWIVYSPGPDASWLGSDIALYKRTVIRAQENSVPQPPAYAIRTLAEINTFGVPYLAFDLETTGLDPLADGAAITKIIITRCDGETWIVKDFTKTDLAAFLAQCRVTNTRLIMHNAAFDLYWLYAQLGQTFTLDVDDTMLLAHNRGLERVGLKRLSYELLDMAPSTQFGSFEDDAYAAQDGVATMALYQHFYEKKTIDSVTAMAVGTMARQRARGVRFDVDVSNAEKQRLIESTEPALAALGQVSIMSASAPAFGYALLADLGYKLSKKTEKTGKLVLDDEVLKDALTKVQDKAALQALIDVRSAGKLLSTFYTPYPRHVHNGMLRPEQRLDGTTTGRTSMQNPNLQQVPREPIGIHKAFTSSFDGGYFASFDLSQAELRVLAWLTGEPGFVLAFERGDIHTYNASVLFDVPYERVTKQQRSAAKSPTFAIVYGASPKTSEEKQLHESFYARFPTIKPWLQRQGAEALRELYVTDALGRRRNLRRAASQLPDHAIMRRGVNTPIQALASHCSVFLQSHIDTALTNSEAKSYVTMGIHDATYIDVAPEEVELVIRTCQDAFTALHNVIAPHVNGIHSVPVLGELEFGRSWHDLKVGKGEHKTELTTRH